ncbi:glutathione S-transferase family protein [Bosea psychrotolerans]|uniref:Glutathione S-transferase n=1 Tax=Bosea psychrotolerans TaxID=1871628 RepID=A0A2S4LYY0_9HYPH|nr:glutathione S-transferase family protein [Bosea psychrotolerans]POR47618.1 glutathione S-transferase [Bosea psychrotolerans]
MITLHSFGPGFGLPDPSPFCIKAEILLRMSGLPFERVTGNMRNAPKGKLPMIVEDGVTIPDSSFIRFHLESAHGIDFDAGLTPEQRGIAWAVEKMLEEQLYWIVVHERWIDRGNFDRGPRHFFKAVPAPLRPLIIAMVKRKVQRNLDGQGIGRHSAQERLVLTKRAYAAIAGILGERQFLLGDTPCGADAALGAFTMSALSPVFDSAIRGVVESHPNLVAYEARIRARFFPEAAAVKAAA